MVDPLSPYSAVMHGIELGAVDVLEKPLSSLKLRNIWQHVVRKACPCRGMFSHGGLGFRDLDRGYSLLCNSPTLFAWGSSAFSSSANTQQLETGHADRARAGARTEDEQRRPERWACRKA